MLPSGLFYGQHNFPLKINWDCSCGLNERIPEIRLPLKNHKSGGALSLVTWGSLCVAWAALCIKPVWFIQAPEECSDKPNGAARCNRASYHTPCARSRPVTVVGTFCCADEKHKGTKSSVNQGLFKLEAFGRQRDLKSWIIVLGLGAAAKCKS